MGNSWRNYLLNLAKLARGESLLDPLVVTYYLTTNCNLNCVYCEDFGSRLNDPSQIPSNGDAAQGNLPMPAGSPGTGMPRENCSIICPPWFMGPMGLWKGIPGAEAPGIPKAPNPGVCSSR